MKGWILAVCALTVAQPARGQQFIPVGSELDHYVRLLELDGAVRGTALVFRPGPAPTATDSTHPWFSTYPLSPGPARTRRVSAQFLGGDVSSVFNSAYPRTTNDGTLWAGRGVAFSLSAGARAAWGPLVATLYPLLTYSQNREFELAPVLSGVQSPYGYPFYTQIDFPQRFGPNAFTSVDWGQSSVRMSSRAVTAAVSNENLWWGPGYRNAIVMSNTAPGFAHVDAGTAGQLATPIGRVEVRAVWGSLQETGFFDTIADNDRRFITGATIGYGPSFLPGLSVGLTRVLMQTWPAGGLGPADLFGFLGRFFNSRGGATGQNDRTNQLVSLVGRWVLPASGFETYFEWAREDFSGSLRDFLVEPDHSDALTIGFQKSVRSRTAQWRLAGEFTGLGRSMTFLLRDAGTIYTHGFVRQGYTHRGQLLGAGIGPGSSSQFLGLDRYTQLGRWGVYLGRVSHDDDAVYDRFRATPFGYEYHDIELTVGTSGVRFTRWLDLEGSVELTRELNRYFQRRRDATNLKVTLTARPRSR